MDLTRKQRAVLDRYGAVCARIDESRAKLQPKIDERSALEAEIASWCESIPANTGDVLEGSKYLVKVSPKRLKRTIIDKAQLFKRIGEQLFVGLASFPLGAFDQLPIPDSELSAYIHEERTGDRTIEPVALIGAAESKKKKEPELAETSA